MRKFLGGSKTFIQEIGLLLKEASMEWMDDNAFRLAASLAYYTLFSMAPLLIMVLAIAGAVFDRMDSEYLDFRGQSAQNEMIRQVEFLLGDEGADVVRNALEKASRPGTNIASVASIVSLVIFLFAATNVFAELQDALNTVWGVRLKPGFGVKGFIRTRLLSFTIVLAIGFLLLVSLIVNAAISAMGKYMTYLLPDQEAVIQITNLGISFGVITVLFAMLYKFLPDVLIRWRDVMVGAVVTSLLFSLGKFLIGLYLGKGAFGSTYGAAGSLVVLLAWVYYSALIFFFGAELTLVYTRKFGHRIVPNEFAEKVKFKEPVIKDKPRPEVAE